MNNLVKYFLENKMIDYGRLLTRFDLEQGLNAKYHHEHIWDFLGKYLQLKEEIEEMGYQCTSRNCNPGELKILGKLETLNSYEKKMKKVIRYQKKNTNSMLNYNCPQEEISRNTYINLLDKNVMINKAMKSVLSTV
jgi:hypothetical protein